MSRCSCWWTGSGKQKICRITTAEMTLCLLVSAPYMNMDTYACKLDSCVKTLAWLLSSKTVEQACGQSPVDITVRLPCSKQQLQTKDWIHVCNRIEYEGDGSYACGHRLSTNGGIAGITCGAHTTTPDWAATKGEGSASWLDVWQLQMNRRQTACSFVNFACWI
jgi:hypothetical protein